MSLQESGEMYLESIYMLTKSKGAVRSIDIVEYMNYSKPSVSRAVKLLKNGEFILIDEHGQLLNGRNDNASIRIFKLFLITT